LIDYVTKQNQLQLLETADESDPSGSPSPACEFLFSSPGDSSIDPFIMQALGENEVVMEMGNLGNYTAVPGLNHHHHHHSHHHLHHHSHLSRPHQHVDMASVNSMNAASLLEMNPLSALSGMGITMESYGLRQQPVRRFTMVPSASMSVIHPPTKSRKTSSGSGSKASAKKKADKAKKKALRRAEKEKRKEQRRRKREKKQKLNEKKRAEKEGQQQLGEAVIVEKKESSAGKKRERDESHKSHPTKEFHKQPRLESSSKSGTKPKESKGTPKKSKSSIKVKPEPIDATEGAPTSAFISAGPAPTSAFLASPAATTPASTPIPSNVSAAAKMAASLGPSMMSLASAVQFQQRTNYGQPMLTQQRMLYPMIMPRLQPPSVLPPPVPGILPPVSATAAAAAVVAATASMCGVILPNPPSTSRTNSPTPPLSSASSPSSLRAQPSGAATAPTTSPSCSSPASALVGASADVAAPAGEQSLAPATTAPVSVGAPSAADGTASEAPVPEPIIDLAPGLASPTTDPIASTPASATIPVSPASPSAVGDSANLKRKQPEDTESQEEADKIAAAVAACLAGPAKKRKRRTAAEIERKYKCEMPNCTKSYGSEGALKMHVKLKHPGVKQPALKTPTGVAPRINTQSSLPLLLQFPLPFMPGLMGGSQPIFPAPSPAALAAANSALVSAMNASVASTPVPRPQAAQATSPPTPSPATAPSTAPAAGSASAPPFLAMPSASSSSSLPSSTSSSTSNSVLSSSPSPAVPRVSATSLIPKLSAFLASSPSPLPSPGSAFSSFSVHGAPMTSPFARSAPAAPSSSLSTPPIRSAAATTTTPALALPSAPAAASSSDSVLVVPSLVLPTVLSDLKPPSSSLAAASHLFEAIARLPTAAEPAALGGSAPAGGDQQQLALLPCKLEVIETGEASDSCGGGFDSAYSSPRLASDDISSSTSPSSPSHSPSPMSPPVSAADLLVDTLGESMLSLPPAMLMDEESATTAPDPDATAIASDDLHTVLSISEANLGDVLLSAVGDSSINGNCNGQGGASSDSVGAGGSVQPPFDLPSSFFNPLSFAGDELEHMRSPAEREAAPAPGEPQPNQPPLQQTLAVAPSFGGGVYDDDDDERLQRALDGQEQNRDGEDLLDESPFHTGAFLVNGCSDDLAQLPRLSFSQHTIDSL
jgi:hypothetical protein